MSWCSILSMNIVGKLVETILSKTNIADTSELAEAVAFLKGLVVVLFCTITQDTRRPGTLLLLGEIGI